MNFNIIRVVAIFFVIVIHSMAGLDAEAHNSVLGRVMCSLLNSFIYAGVPLFVMLSGALLLGKDEPIPVFFKKRINRLIIPFITWSIVVYGLNAIIDTGGEYSVWDGIYKFLTSGVYGIYWYIYLILGLYLLTPVFREVKSRYLTYIIVVFYIVDALFPDFKICSRFECENLVYLSYFLLGYDMKTYVSRHHYFRMYSLMGLLISLGFSFYVIYNDIETNFPFIYFTSICLFNILVSMNVKGIEDYKLQQIVNYVSRVSYGIYLSHILFISVLIKIGFESWFPIAIEPLCMSIVVMFLAIMLMFILDKLKLSRLFM